MKMTAAPVLVLCLASAGVAHASSPADTVLVDQRGAAFTLSALRGSPLVVAFVATRCTDACPLVGALFAQLARARIAAELVTITLDPGYDTPFVMSRYARAWGALAPHWRMASGKPAAVETVIAALGVQRAADDVHSTFVYCLDARGRLVQTLPLSTDTAREVRVWLAGGSRH